jgi:hypothetical protein
VSDWPQWVREVIYAVILLVVIGVMAYATQPEEFDR